MMLGAILTVALNVVTWILSKNKENKEMQELYLKFIERQSAEYLNSAQMRDAAKARLKKILELPFEETP